MYYLSRRGLSKRRYHFHFRWRIEIHDMLCENSEIPPTEVGGMFRSNLPRRWLRNLGIPPTAVGGWFRSNLPRWASKLGNPTNGSWWMVQIQPTEMGLRNLGIPPTAVGGWFSRFVSKRQDLNNPPTAVGGIYRSASPLFVERI